MRFPEGPYRWQNDTDEDVMIDRFGNEILRCRPIRERALADLLVEAPRMYAVLKRIADLNAFAPATEAGELIRLIDEKEDALSELTRLTEEMGGYDEEFKREKLTVAAREDLEHRVCTVVNEIEHLVVCSNQGTVSDQALERLLSFATAWVEQHKGK